MSIPCAYRPVILEYPHDVVMGPASGPQARTTYMTVLDTIPAEKLIEAAESVCELVAEDFDLDDASAERVFGADGFDFDVAAGASTPAIVTEIRSWITAGIDEACWEDRYTNPAGATVVRSNVEHIGGHPYTVAVTNDDTTHAGPLIFKELRLGCVSCRG